MKRLLNTLVYPSLLMAWLIIAVGVYGSSSQYDFVRVFIIPLDLPRLALLAHIQPLQYLLDLFRAFFGIAVFSAASMSLGLAVIGSSHDFEGSGLAWIVTAFLLGQMIYSVLYLTCMVLYRLTPRLVVVTLVPALLVSAPRVRGWLRAGLPVRPLADVHGSDMVILTLSIIVIAVTLLYSASILGYDAVVQYFTQPKLLADTQTAAIAYPRDPFLVSSLHSEILYTGLIQTFGDQAARLLSWVNGLAILLMGLAIGKMVGLTLKARIWFVALMLTSTAYVDLLGDGKVELISTAPIMATAYWMLRSLKTPTRVISLLIGCLSGFAMIARPYNIILVPVFAGIFYAVHFITRKRSERQEWRPYFSTGLWVLPPLLALGAFHLWQNWLWAGSPVAPLLAAANLGTSSWQWQIDLRLLNLYRLLYPLAATFANSPQSLGLVTPFVVGALPFLLEGRVRTELRQQPAVLWLALCAAITAVAWLVISFTVLEIRYVFFAWALVFLFAAQLIDIVVDRLRMRAAILLTPLVIFSLVYMGVRTVIIALGSYSPVDRTGQAHCYFFDLCTFMEPLNTAAAPGARVLVFNAYRYYLRPDLFTCSSRAQEYSTLVRLAKEKSPDFWVEVYREGFRYITYESNFSLFHVNFGELPPTEPVPDWLRVRLFSSNTEGPYGIQLIYVVEATQPAVRQQTYCEQGGDGRWQIRYVSPVSRE